MRARPLQKLASRNSSIGKREGLQFWNVED